MDTSGADRGWTPTSPYPVQLGILERDTATEGLYPNQLDWRTPDEFTQLGSAHDDAGARLLLGDRGGFIMRSIENDGSIQHHALGTRNPHMPGFGRPGTDFATPPIYATTKAVTHAQDFLGQQMHVAGTDGLVATPLGSLGQTGRDRHIEPQPISLSEHVQAVSSRPLPAADARTLARRVAAEHNAPAMTFRVDDAAYSVALLARDITPTWRNAAFASVKELDARIVLPNGTDIRRVKTAKIAVPMSRADKVGLAVGVGLTTLIATSLAATFVGQGRREHP